MSDLMQHNLILLKVDEQCSPHNGSNESRKNFKLAGEYFICSASCTLTSFTWSHRTVFRQIIRFDILFLLFEILFILNTWIVQYFLFFEKHISLMNTAIMTPKIYYRRFNRFKWVHARCNAQIKANSISTSVRCIWRSK